MHPWEYDPDHPNIEFPRAFPKFTHYLNLHSTVDKTRKLFQDFKFTTIKDAYGTEYLSRTVTA